MAVVHRFHEAWHVAAPPDEVARTLSDLAAYPSWWPEVVAVAALGGDRARVLCRSRLPYTLDLVLTAVTKDAPRLEVEVEGHLQGWVRFDLVADPGPAGRGEGTLLDFHQEVVATGWLGLASRPLRPLLHWNHHRMMQGCRDGLRRHLVAAAQGDGQAGPPPVSL